MYGLFGFVEILSFQNYVNSTGNCVQYIFELFGLTKNLNVADTLYVQNCVNLIGNCVH